MAAQNWCLLRLLPLYIGEKIKHPVDSEVWQLCLKLRDIVDIVCAPKISHNDIAYLKILIEDYIHLRHSRFPDKALKAKHHYLLHYAELILHFGPHIRLWTLRFESKHSYFKACTRTVHNFVNLCKTLTERHQLLQSYLSVGQLFPPTVQIIGEASDYNHHLYNAVIQEAVAKAGCTNQTTLDVSAVVHKGTKYVKGYVSIVDDSDDGLVFGKIAVILVNDSGLYFVLELHQSVLLIDLGLHCLRCPPERSVCVNADSLMDYYPLPLYNMAGLFVVSLHHSVSS